MPKIADGDRHEHRGVPAGVTTAATADAVIAAVATGPELTTRNDVPVSTTATMSRATAISAPVAPMANSPNGMAATVRPRRGAPSTAPAPATT